MEKKQADDYKRQKISGREILFQVCNYGIFGLFTVLCAYPFYYLIINSISSNVMSANGDINFWPRQIHFQNYKDTLQLAGLANAAMTSVARTVVGTACTVLASAFLGYMFTQQKMWHRKLWYRMMVITMYFNAGVLVRFFRVTLPLCTPILATIAIWAAVGQWNSFQDTLLYVTDQKLYTLQYILYTYFNQASSLATLVKSSQTMTTIANIVTAQTPTSIRMTISVIVVLPILFVYPMFQKYFVKGIMIGAVKG